MMIPQVRTWKVTVEETGEVFLVDTINKRFARMTAIETHALWGRHLKVSLHKPKEVFSKDFQQFGFSQPEW